MSAKQDKATTERHARTLRELLKRPENKACADCKRNDPRWASWNLGVFLCIRCSGIHRSMGTHISKVKSVDLDVWTPEQMASIQKWGNRRANAYWEAHLRAGHIPPDHKMDSYIRSKYDSKRWAREGPPPDDPSVFDGEAPAPEPAPAAAPVQTHAARASVSSMSSATATAPRTQQPQPHQLLSAAVAASRQSPAPPALTPPRQQSLSQPPAQAQAPVQAQAQQQQPAGAAVDLFSLDFHAPASAAPAPAAEQPKKNVHAEIMSLFATATPATAPAQQGMFGAQPQAAGAQGQFGGMGGMGGMAGMGGMGGMGGMQPQANANVWGNSFAQPAQPGQPQQTSMMGNAGVGMWGASSGWNAPPQPQQQQANIWATPAAGAQANLFSTSDVWGAPASAPATNGGAFGATAQKKDDAFGDIWGGFK